MADGAEAGWLRLPKAGGVGDAGMRGQCGFWLFREK